MTELMAAHGAPGIGSNEIARHAGVSLAAFYECFDGKEACALAGYDRFIEVLFHAMNAVDVGSRTRPELVCGLSGRTWRLSADLVVARAYQVEIDSLGASVRKRRRDSLLLFAHHLWGVSSDDSDRARPGAAALVGLHRHHLHHEAAGLRCPRHRREAGSDRPERRTGDLGHRPLPLIPGFRPEAESRLR